MGQHFCHVYFVTDVIESGRYAAKLWSEGFMWRMRELIKWYELFGVNMTPL